MNKSNLSILLCRHGETEWTQSGQHTGTRTDLPLTENGKNQALELGKYLQKFHCTKIFTSPLRRAKETSSLAGFDKIAMEDPRLIEWDYGDYEGLTSAQIKEKNPSWNLFLDGSPRGEPRAVIQHRADAFIKSLLNEHGNVAVFSHGHFLRILAARWIGLSAEMGRVFSLSVASLSILTFEDSQPIIKLWNETSYL